MHIARSDGFFFAFSKNSQLFLYYLRITWMITYLEIYERNHSSHFQNLLKFVMWHIQEPIALLPAQIVVHDRPLPLLVLH